MRKNDFDTIDEEQKSINDLYNLQEKQLKAIESLVKDNVNLQNNVAKALSYDLKSRATRSSVDKEETKRYKEELQKLEKESSLRTKLYREDKAKAEAEGKRELENLKREKEEEKIKELKRKNAYKEEKDNLTLKKASLQIKHMQEDREIQLKQRQSTAYQNNIFYKAGSNIKSQESSGIASTALSVMTGGMINPVIAQTLGLDKLLSAAFFKPFRVAGNAWENRKERKRDSSAIDEVNNTSKETNGLLRKIADGITDLGKNKEEKKEEKKEDSWLSQIFGLVKGIGTFFAIGGLAYTAIKNFDKIKETAGNVVTAIKELKPGSQTNKKWEEKTGGLLNIEEDDSIGKTALKVVSRGAYNLFENFGMTVNKVMEGIGGKWLENGFDYLLNKWDPLNKKNVPGTVVPKEVLYAPGNNQTFVNENQIDNASGGYGSFNTSSYNSDDVVIHNRPATSLESMSLSGDIASTNSIPYIAEQNVSSLKNLDSALDSWGYDVIYTSAMGGHRPGTGHWKGNKVDLQLKKNGKPAHLNGGQLTALRDAGYWGSGTGALGWEPVRDQVGGGHYDLFLGNGGGSISTNETRYASNYNFSNIGKASEQSFDMKSESVSTPIDEVNDSLNNMGELMVENMNNQDATAGLSSGGGTNYAQAASAPIIINNSTGSSGDSSIYATGDVARSMILGVI